MTNLGSTPPPGALIVRLPVAPVSLQASTQKKEVLRNELRGITRTAEFLLSGDVSITVEWLIQERARYETDRSPDIDNILKPVLDSLCGPEGILIDDNQVQHIACSWLDWTRESEELRIEIRYAPEEYLPKKDLSFVQVGGSLCLPIPGNVSAEFQRNLICHFSRMLATRAEFLKDGVTPELASIYLPMQRVFHRSRIGNFPVLRPEDFGVQFA